MNITLDVKRSDPLKTIITSPTGKVSAPIVLINPGAFSWYHGDAFVETRTAQPKPKSGPVIRELTNSLSKRMWDFFVPVRETSSIVCCGVNASISAVTRWQQLRQLVVACQNRSDM